MHDHSHDVWCLPVHVTLNADKVKNTESLTLKEIFAIYGDNFLAQDDAHRFYEQQEGYKKLKGEQPRDRKELLK